MAVRAPTRLRPVSRAPSTSTGTSDCSASVGNSDAASAWTYSEHLRLARQRHVQLRRVRVLDDERRSDRAGLR